MAIVAATEKDIDLLTRMNIELREDERIDNVMTEAQVKERMIDRLASSYRAYLFTSKGEVRGYALVDHGRTPLYLCQLFIERGERSKGYGELLFKELLEYLHADVMDVEVLDWNDRARRFYERIGFEPRYIGLRYDGKRPSHSAG
jgi:ribosomal protein S18 acetylase RimI-like enzyme